MKSEDSTKSNVNPHEKLIRFILYRTLYICIFTKITKINLFKKIFKI